MLDIQNSARLILFFHAKKLLKCLLNIKSYYLSGMGYYFPANA